MKYSTVIVAAFAAGAMARAIPDEAAEAIKVISTPTETFPGPGKGNGPPGGKGNGPPGGKGNGPPGGKVENEDNYKEKEVDTYKEKNEDSYKEKNVDQYENNNDQSKKGKKQKPQSYEVEYPKDEEVKYSPKKTCEDNRDNKHWAPTPYDGKDDEFEKYKKNSYFKDLSWNDDVYAGKKCKIQYKRKDNDHKKPVKVWVYGSDDFTKPIEECGEDKDNKGYVDWTPKQSWIPSDCKDKGRAYYFKICDAEDETKYTWSQQIPVYNPVYYKEKPEAKPDTSKCPPPTAPVYKVTVPVAQEETPACTGDCPTAETPETEAPATEVPATEAPAVPETPACTGECPTADTPASLAPEASTNATDLASSEELAPAVVGAGSAVKVSVSFMVGIAALVTFAL